MMFAPGIARGVASGSVGASRPQGYGRQQDEVEDPEVEMGKPVPAASDNAHEAQERPQDILSGEHRAGFIRKVYGILAAQMMMTTLTCACAMLIPPVRSFFLGLMAIPYASLLIFAPAICVLCALQVKKAEHPTNYYLLWTFTALMSVSVAGICVLCALQVKKAEHPTNYYLLWTFTALMSVSVAGICAVYQQAGLGNLVLQAFAITAACFLGLTAYACKSGKDFQWMGGMLSMGLMGMMMFSFLGFLFGFHGGIIYSLFGVVLFCGYILYDTQRVMQIYGPDDAIMASIELYLDILNLFLYILELLSSMQGQQS